MAVTTNTRKLAALLGASGAGIGTDGLMQAAAVDTNLDARVFPHTTSTSNPALNTNPSATGHVWYNKTTGQSFICTDATGGANVWKNTKGVGQIGPAYTLSWLVIAGGGSGGTGITTLPHLRDLIIRGPISVTGLSDTPSRERIFICRPTGSTEEGICARKIIALSLIHI